MIIDINKIIQRYKETYNAELVAKEINISGFKVRKMLKKAGITNLGKKSILDHSYFENINTEKKAYFLGLLASDGNIKGNRIRITILKLDCDLLQIFLDDIKSNLQLKTSCHKIRKTEYSTFCVQSTNNVKALKKLNIIEKKSLILEPPDIKLIPEELLHHFIRGYFDGDGSIFFTKIKGRHKKAMRAGIDIVSTFKMLGFIQNFLNKYNIISQIIPIKNTKSYKLIIQAQESILGFYEQIYKNTSVFMKRKKTRFLNFIEHIKTRTGSSKYKFIMQLSNGKWRYSIKINGKYYQGQSQTEKKCIERLENFMIKKLNKPFKTPYRLFYILQQKIDKLEIRNGRNGSKSA